MRPKVFVVDNDPLITRMFMNNSWVVVPKPEEADLIQFTGGADVSPMLYGEPKHPSTYCHPDRDQHESNIFHEYLDTPKAGICRGGQFLNVMSGGSMFQDVDRHAIHGTHKAFGHNGLVIDVTSTHHQMMDPGVTSDLFLWAELSTRKEDGWQENQVGRGMSMGVDAEGVWYEDTNSLCFQPHPEYVDTEHECQRFYFEMLYKYFGLTTEAKN